MTYYDWDAVFKMSRQTRTHNMNHKHVTPTMALDWVEIDNTESRNSGNCRRSSTSSSASIRMRYGSRSRKLGISIGTIVSIYDQKVWTSHYTIELRNLLRYNLTTTDCLDFLLDDYILHILQCKPKGLLICVLTLLSVLSLFCYHPGDYKRIFQIGTFC